MPTTKCSVATKTDMDQINRNLINRIGNAVGGMIPSDAAYLIVVVGPRDAHGNRPDFGCGSNVRLEYARRIARVYLEATVAEAGEN